MPTRPRVTPTPTTSVALFPEGRKPRHQEVLDALLMEITTGRLQPGDRLPTEAELAKAFRASRSTVARAMRDLKGRGLLSRQRGGGTHVTREIRKAVHDAARRIALFTPWTKTREMLGHVGGQIHAHLSDQAASRSDHLRLQFIRAGEGDVLERMQATARTLIEEGVEGIFYYPVELPAESAHYNQVVVDELLGAGLAVVLVDRDIVSFPERSNLPFVTYDNRRGGYLITEHLVKQGCRRIAFVTLPFASSAASERLRGYCDALDDAGLGVDRSLIFKRSRGGLDAEFCRSVMETAKPDAIVCKMDHYAAIVGRHLMAMGVRIGRDVRLAGFDDEPFAELLPVPLTTIRFPAETFARVCYQRLGSQLAMPAGMRDGWQSIIDVQLIVRESTLGLPAV